MRKTLTIALLVVFAGILLKPDANSLSAAPSTHYSRIGKASWYSRYSPGINKQTANNEIFNDRGLTCAIWGVEFNRFIRVTNLQNGKSIVVRVNDRGPHPRLIREGRVIDLTLEAFSRLGAPKKGLIDVEIEFL